MKLIAKKPCSFGGKKFYIGDEIPAEFVLNPKMQEKQGVLAIVAGEPVIAPPVEEDSDALDTMTVFVHCEEGDLPLNLKQAGLQAAVDVLTSNAKDAELIVKQMTDGDALIFLDIADSRKTIKEAAKARAQAINTEPEGVEEVEPSEPENPEESAGDQ